MAEAENEHDYAALLDLTLVRAVAITTGIEGATARPGQVVLAHDVMKTMLANGQSASDAPTGCGKSMAYLVPAAILAATKKERTVIATESLNLQSQLVDKDLPVVVEATEKVLGVRPTFTLLKGWSNYTCAAAVHQAVGELVGLTQPGDKDDPLMVLDAAKQSLEKLGILSPTEEVVRWAINEHLFDNTGDRATLTLDVDEKMWQSVSTTSEECPGADRCEFGAVCRPTRAREKASESDIIVTNHAMIAVQAANRTPVVIGNRVVDHADNPIRHIVIDEAHGLASTVRSQGATNINAMRLWDILRAVERLHANKPGETKALRATGLDLMNRLDRHLATMVPASKSIFTVHPDKNALTVELDVDISSWLAHAKNLVPKPDASLVIREIRARQRVMSRIDGIKESVSKAREETNNFAVWVDFDRRPTTPITGLESITAATLRISPVDVAPLLRSNLYGYRESVRAEGEPEEDPISVSVLSATLPQSVVVDLGVMARRKEYESPFAVAFANSVLYVPKVGDRELDEFCVSANGKRRFDTGKHVEWAAKRVVELVAANGGSALILSATTAGGKRYAEALREAHPEIKVHSQWDAGATRHIVAQWREDIGSVMVGTRSMMTGVDAPGETLSLVIVDRVPRSAGNPVDDARVSRIQERMEIDKWAADRLVFVSDAALLIEQAAGRLVRSVTDSGMVAVLDPRLLKTSPIKYQAQTRELLMSALDKFDNKVSDPLKAFAWLEGRRDARRMLESGALFPTEEPARKGVDFEKIRLAMEAERAESK